MEDDGEAEEGDGVVWRKAPVFGETVVGGAADVRIRDEPRCQGQVREDEACLVNSSKKSSCLL